MKFQSSWNLLMQKKSIQNSISLFSPRIHKKERLATQKFRICQKENNYCQKKNQMRSFFKINFIKQINKNEEIPF